MIQPHLYKNVRRLFTGSASRIRISKSIKARPTAQIRRFVARYAHMIKYPALAATDSFSCLRYRFQIRLTASALLEERDFAGRL